MKSRVLYQLPCTTPGKELARAWQWQHATEGILALVYVSDIAKWYPTSTTLTLLLLDVNTGKLLQSASWTLPLVEIEVLRLISDPLTATWLIGSLEWRSGLYHIAGRAVTPDLLITSLFDDRENDVTPLGPLYTMYVLEKKCVVMYRKPAPYFHDNSNLYVGRIDVETKEEERGLVGSADSAMVWTDEHTALVLALNPRTAGTWGFQLSRYDAAFHTKDWQQELYPRLTETITPVLQNESDFEWLGINASMSPGTLPDERGEPTWVVGATLMDVFRFRDHGHTSAEASQLPRKVDLLIWLNAAGDELQRCSEPIGLCVQMCRIQSTIVGVDLLNGQWRLWNWAPQQAASFQSVVWLDASLASAHVLAEEGGTGQVFWLIEAMREGVRISQRDARTLTEVVPGETLFGVQFLDPQNGPGALDWHTEMDVAIYQGKLLLLGMHESNQLVLYQVG
jgi:hypothetical protein